MLKIYAVKRFMIFYVIIASGLFFYIKIWHLRDFGIAPVRGWEGNISRNITHYVKKYLKPHIMPKRFCQRKKTLVIIVASRPGGSDYREAIRSTWGRRDPNVTFAFLTGETSDPALQQQIVTESKLYGDIIQERFLDTYNNLTLKTVFMLKTYLRHCARSHNFLMKVDDDIYLNVSRILNLLNSFKTTPRLLIGRRRSYLAPYRNPNSKWYVPYDWYPNDTYPPFLCGPGYIMSTSVALNLYHCTKIIPLIPLEDVYFTGICAEYMRIYRFHTPFFQCNGIEDSICENRYSYLIHYFSPEEIKQTYQLFKNNLCLNKSEQHRDFNAIKQWVFFYKNP